MLKVKVLLSFDNILDVSLWDKQSLRLLKIHPNLTYVSTKPQDIEQLFTYGTQEDVYNKSPISPLHFSK